MKLNDVIPAVLGVGTTIFTANPALGAAVYGATDKLMGRKPNALNNNANGYNTYDPTVNTQGAYNGGYIQDAPNVQRIGNIVYLSFKSWRGMITKF